MSKTYKKLRKLVRSPRQFFADFVELRRTEEEAPRPVLGVQPFAEEEADEHPYARLHVDGERSCAQLDFESPLHEREDAIVIGIEEHVVVPQERDEGGPAPVRAHDADGVALELVRGEGSLWSPGRNATIELTYGPYATPWEPHRLIEYLARRRLLPSTWPIADARGYLVVRNPLSIAPLLLGMSFSDLRCVVFIDAPLDRLGRLADYLEYADCVVSTYDDPAFEDLGYHQRVASVERYRAAFETYLQNIKLDEDDPFIPIVAGTDRDADFDGDRFGPQVDGVLFHRNALPEPERFRDFASLTDAIFDATDAFYLRSSTAQRFASDLEAGRARTMLGRSMRGGARLTFVRRGGRP